MRREKHFRLDLLLLTAAIIFSGACASKTVEIPNSVEAAETKSSVNREEDARINAALDWIEKTPDSPDGYNRLATAYIRRARETGDFSLNTKAEAAIKRALEIEPANVTARKLAASLSLTFHRFDAALEAGKKLQQDFPRDAFVYGVLTDANVELGNYQEAVKAAQMMVDLRPNMESYARVAHLRSLHGDTKGAIEAMTTAARIADPQDHEAQSWCLAQLGEEYFKNGKFAEAEARFDEALQIFPEYYLALAGKAKTRAAQADTDAAIRLYVAAQNRVPSMETVIALGDLYAKKGDNDKAQQQYDLAEIAGEKFGSTDARRLALLRADRDVRLDEALTLAAQENANRRDVYTADVYAWCLYKKGKFAEARAAAKEAMRLKTNDARIFYHAGMIEKALGNEREAARYLKLALETNPAFDVLQAEKAKETLRELK